MTLKFRTDTPADLLAAFKKLINQRERKGKIDTWEEYDGGFRHTAPDWKARGLFRSSISGDGKYLLFSMKKVEDPFAYAYYHGHLLQTFIEHLNARFQWATYVDGRKR